MDEATKKLIEDLQAKVKANEDEKTAKDAELSEAKKKVEEAEAKEKESKLKLHIEKKLVTISDPDIRALVGEALAGKTEEEVDKQFDKQIAILKKATEGKVIIRPVDGDKSVDLSKNVEDFMKSAKAEDQLALLREAMSVPRAA